ncbi:MAG: histidine kinase [Bacteroidales bacterium]|nr:histidine kinase [Bacteroidales bacterium]
MKNKLQNIFSVFRKTQHQVIYAYILAIIPAFIIILLDPVDFNKFKAELNISRNRNQKMQFQWFDDLEGDGKKELFVIEDDQENKNLQLLAYNDNKLLLDQTCFNNPNTKTRHAYFPISTDLTSDGVKEIFFFTQKNDSLFLNIFNYAKNNILLRNRFITTIGVSDKHTDYLINWITADDVTGDNINEVFFSISAGFALYPRRLFRYDFIKDSLISSINTGAGVLQAHPFKQDDKLVFITGSGAVNNIGSDYPYPYKDSCCWVFGFDQDLKFIFEPLAFSGSPGTIRSIYEYDNYYYFALSGNRANGENNKIVALDYTGKIINIKEFNDPIGNLLPVYLQKDLIYFEKYDNKIYAIDKNTFREVKKHKLRGLENKRFLKQEDIDQDDETEYFFFDYHKNLVVLYRSNFKHEVYLPIHFKDTPTSFISTKINKNIVEIILNAYEKIYTYNYYRNPYYFLKFPFWVLVYSLSVFFVRTIQYFQKKQIEKRHENEQRIVQLQLQNLRNQLDPHFTFNAMNSIGFHIYEENKEKAYDYFVRFSRLIRSSLLSSDRVFRSLEEEIQFTEDYLEFQKERFETVFDFSFNIDPDVDTKMIQVPKMLIQGYAENAVKHAFGGLNRKGELIISIQKKLSAISIQIKDNGIGRKASAKQKPAHPAGGTKDSGRGMAVMEEQIHLLNKYQNKKIELNIVDLYNDDNTSAGTTIEVLISI